MEIDPEKHKELMIYTMKMFKALETQLLAQTMVLHSLKIYHSAHAEIDQALELAANSPALQQMMDAKYDSAVERLAKQFDQAIGEEELSKWMREWKPQDPPN
jgi:hypothetical protein